MPDSTNKLSDLELLNRTGKTLARLSKQEDALQTILDVLKEKSNFKSGSIYLLNQDGLLELQSYFPSKISTNQLPPRNFKLGEGIAGKTAQAGEILYIADTTQSADFVEHDQDTPKTLLCLPLMDQDKVFGIMNLSGESGKIELKPADYEFVQTLAHMTVVTTKNIQMRKVIEVHNQILEQQVKEKVDAIENLTKAQNLLIELHTITQDVSGILDLKKAAQVFIKRTVLAIHPKGAGSILFFNEKINKLIFYASYHLNPKVTKTFEVPVAPETWYTHDVFTHQKTKIFDQKFLDTYHNQDIANLHYGKPLIQQLAVPLISQGKSLGIITLTNYDSNQLYTDNDRYLLENLVNGLSGHFENVFLYEKTQRKEQEIAHINEVVQMVNSSLNLENVLASVMKALQEFVEFDQIFVFLVDGNREKVTLEHYQGTEIDSDQYEKLKNFDFPLDPSLSYISVTVHSNEPFYCPNITPDFLSHFLPVERRFLEITSAKSYFLFPVPLHQEVIGTVGLINTHRSIQLSEEDITKIQRYVKQIGTGLNNARIYREIEYKLAESKKVANLLHAFEKFVPKQFLNRIAKGGVETIELGKAESDLITILFTDIRAFTTLSEKMPPQKLLNYLNAYFTWMNKPIHSNNGFIDKFIGDAIIALFEYSDQNPEHPQSHAKYAIQAAIDMQNTLQMYNQFQHVEDAPPLESGIGIHSGPVVIGTIGSEDRMDSTVLGDSVNIAARLEALTKYYKANIIVSEYTLNLTQPCEEFDFRVLDFVRVKGRLEPIWIYEVYNGDPPKIHKLKTATKSLLKQGLDLRSAKRWDEAIEVFQSALQISPDDHALKIHLKVCYQLKYISLPSNWDGAVEQETNERLEEMTEELKQANHVIKVKQKELEKLNNRLSSLDKELKESKKRLIKER